MHFAKDFVGRNHKLMLDLYVTSYSQAINGCNWQWEDGNGRVWSSGCAKTEDRAKAAHEAWQVLMRSRKE